jgi:cytochrome c oxidase subunit 2
MPGFMYEAWAEIEKPGVYRGQCTELCGINHGFMPIVVKAVSGEDFAKWVMEQDKVAEKYAEDEGSRAAHANLSQKELMTLGKTKYQQVCMACHKADGKGEPPMFAALKGSSVSTGKPISRHIALVLHGVPGTAMQAYKDQLNDEEIAAIVTYERNAWDNNTGDVVQPEDVSRVRHGDNYTPKMVNKAQVGGLR